MLRNVVNGSGQVLAADANGVTITPLKQTEEDSVAAEREERRRLSEQKLLRVAREAGVFGFRTG